jgi:hypothetical protein
MRTPDTTHTSAHVALREAALALNVRRDGTGHADLTETGYQTLAADLAATLEAVAGLLRSVGIGVRPNATTQGLLAVAQYLDMGGLMARQASGGHERPPVPAMRLDPERCATTDE